MKACQRQEGCHEEEGAKGQFGGVPRKETDEAGEVLW